MHLKLVLAMLFLPLFGVAQLPDSLVWRGDSYSIYPAQVDFYDASPPGKHTLNFTDSLPDGKYALYHHLIREELDCLIEVKNNEISAVTHINERSKTAFTFQHSTASIMYYDAEGRQLFEYSLDYERLINLWDTAGNLTVTEGNGDFLFFHKNGQKKSEGTVENGKYQGYSREYQISGVLSAEGDYDHGKRHGEWIHYNRDGSVSRREIWDNGARLSIEME